MAVALRQLNPIHKKGPQSFFFFIHQALNKFDKNLRFTVDKFHDVAPHVLDLELRDDGIALYTKSSNTGLYVNYNSNVPWLLEYNGLKLLLHVQRMFIHQSI